ncbi:MAG: polysaccharide biosynthesis protein, partial [Bacilli bacterium]|nr:polysaccharide biosynthesis protein [Bacilli bacterium]
NRKMLERDAKITEVEKKITTKDITKKIIFYALPFVAISVLQSAFTMVDVFTVVRSLASIGYTTAISENVLSVLATWGSKLNMIVMSIATGLIMSLIPSIAAAYTIKNYKEVNAKINQAIQTLLLVTVPLAVGISYMASDVWTVFYGYNELNISIFRVLILSQIPLAVCSVIVNTNQTMNNTKQTITALGLSVLAKICLNVPMMHLFNHIGIEAYYAPIVLNMIIDTVCTLGLLKVIKTKTQISYLKSLRTLIKVALCTAIMVVSLMILNVFIPNVTTSRFIAIIQIVIYGIIGIIIYFIVAYKSKTIDEILGKNAINNIFIKIKNKLTK